MFNEFLLILTAKGYFLEISFVLNPTIIRPLVLGDVWRVQRLSQVTISFEVVDGRSRLLYSLEPANLDFIYPCFANIFVSDSQSGAFLVERFFESFR